jgi:S-adenosylmethionine hydrolase
VEAGGWRFVCPDNGVLSLVLDGCGEFRAWRIANADLLPPPRGGPGGAKSTGIAAAPSATFHGRDLFAPAAAAAACGVPCEEFGPPLESIRRLSLPAVGETPDGISGQVIHVDRFGNLISNIPLRDYEEAARRWGPVAIGAEQEVPLVRTYGDARAGALLALRNSTGLLEVAVREASAAERLGLGRGAPVTLRRR